MEKEDWLKLWEENKGLVIVGLIGLLLLSFGILGILLFQQKEPEIEILSVEKEEASTIWIDLEGAVEKPGVYEMPIGSRLNDLLIKAGGLSAEADRDWVELNLNLAQKLVDGVKIYIPGTGELGVGGGESEGEELVAGVNVVSKININTAPVSQLDSLWGIGEARAAAIIKGRPYSSIEELINRKIIPSNVFERIKDEISVF